MIEKEVSIKNFFPKSSQNKNNIIIVKKIFKTLSKEINKNIIPQIESYNKDYKLNFSEKIIKKFSKYKNIVIIGMGGSILGARSIYSFFKNNIKKKYFFLIIWIKIYT